MDLTVAKRSLNGPLHELQRRRHQVRRAVVPGCLELQHHLPGGVELHALVGQRQAGDVAAQFFQRMRSSASQRTAARRLKPPMSPAADDSKKASASVSHCFRCLHAHGLIANASGTGRWKDHELRPKRPWAPRCTCASTMSPMPTQASCADHLRERQSTYGGRIYPRPGMLSSSPAKAFPYRQRSAPLPPSPPDADSGSDQPPAVLGQAPERAVVCFLYRRPSHAS